MTLKDMKRELRGRYEKLKEGEVLLYHTCPKYQVPSILREGIKRSAAFFKIDPRRDRAVFAWTLSTLKKIAKFSFGGAKVIVFRADPEKWFCGDLFWEYSPEEYRKTIRPLTLILQKPELEKEYYYGKECFSPSDVPPEKIVAVKSRTDFLGTAP